MGEVGEKFPGGGDQGHTSAWGRLGTYQGPRRGWFKTCTPPPLLGSLLVPLVSGGAFPLLGPAGPFLLQLSPAPTQAPVLFCNQRNDISPVTIKEMSH